MHNFLDNMEFRQSCIIDHVQDSISKIIEDTWSVYTSNASNGQLTYNITRKMRRDMLEGHDSSYIGDLMRPVYAACSMEGG
jgi:hypothetical protein